LTFTALTRHTREEMLKTGVYKITNKQRELVYIGSTSWIGKSKRAGFYVRWCKHYGHLIRNKHCNKHLQNAWNKYGEENFEFHIEEFVEPDKCIEVEQSYIDSYDFDLLYNILPIAGSSLGYKHTEETRLLMQEIKVKERSKPFTLFHETKGEIKGLNFRGFCKENNLDRSSLHRVLIGKHKCISYKGYYQSKESYENKLKKDSQKTSVHLGVTLDARTQKYKVTVNNKHYGYFKSESEAAEVALLVRQIG
jgi:group I intron endonuclease